MQLKKYETNNIHITFYPQNKGFGFGHNYNAKRINADYLVICNPDVLIDPKSFRLLYDYLENNSDTALVAPKVLYPDGSTQYLIRQKLDVFDYMLRFIPIQFIKKIFDERLAFFESRAITDKNENQEILFASGCFMFYRKPDFEAIGGFDEQFFMYFEDNDICQKTRQYGKKIVYIPKSKVVHFYGRDSHKNGKVFTIFMKSMKTYFDKWGWQFF